jgi:hypothetical protein
LSPSRQWADLPVWLTPMLLFILILEPGAGSIAAAIQKPQSSVHIQPPGRNASPATPPRQKPAAAAIPALVPGGKGASGQAPGPISKLTTRRSLYGVNVAWTEEGPGVENWDRDGGRHAHQLLNLLRLAGASHTRVPVRWADIERVRGRYEWAPLDRLVRQLKAQNLVITGVVRSAPDWAIDATPATRRLFAAGGLEEYRNEQPPNAASYGDWLRFAAALGEHFKGLVHNWEVGFQPDGKGMPIIERNGSGAAVSIRAGGDAPTYTRLLKVFSQGIKRTDPGCLVAVGALSIPKTDFLQAIYGNGGRGAFDAVALCPAAGPNGLDFAWIDACHQQLVGHGDAAKGVWLAEWGWDSYPEDPAGVQQGQQAKLLSAGIAAILARPFIQQADWKALLDTVGHAGNSHSAPGAGLCTQALQSKPAFAAFQKEAMPGLAAAKPRPRAILMGGPQGNAEAAAIHMDLDVNSSAGASPTMWLGVHASEPFPVRWESIGHTLTSRTASWLRLNLFESGWIRRTVESGWTIDYLGLDRLLHALAAVNINVIVQASVVSGMSAADRTTLVKGLAQRYCTGADYSIFRWEFAARGEPSQAEYESFAQALVAVAPERPVGFASTGIDPVRDAEVIARLCAQKRCPLNSFSWVIRGTPTEASHTVRGIRDVLSRYPGLKGTMLMPSMAEASSGLNNISLLQRLVDYCPLEQPHGLLGILTPFSETVSPDGELTQNGRVLALLNRLRGVRLNPHSDVTVVRCLAAKSADAMQLLIWREDGGPSSLPCVLRLHGLPDPSGVRIEQLSEIANARGSAATVPSRRGDDPSDSPDAVADIPCQAGETEALLRLESGAVTLVTVRTHRPPQLEMRLSTPRLQWFAGELMDLDCEIRNNSRIAQNVDVDLLGGPKSATNPLNASLGVIPAGMVRRVRFRARILNGRSGQAYVNVRATSECRSSLAVTIASPVKATLVATRYDVDSAGVAKVRLLLTNSSHMPLLLSVHMAGRTEAGRRDFTLPPNGKPVEYVTPVSAPSKDPGCYPVDVVVEGSVGRFATLQVLVGVSLECRYASLKPAIDGDLSEWTGSDPIGMGRAEQVHGKTWSGPTDLSAYAYLRWDEQFLYVACAVTDDVHFAPFPAPEMLKGDSVQFAFSTDRRLPAAASGYGPGDHEFAMALLDGTHPVLYRFAGPADVGVGIMKRGAVAVRRVGGRTFYEAAIPWSDLGIRRPHEGALFGFSILVNDNDGQGAGYIAWGDGLGKEKRPLLFPPVKLVR